MNKEIERSILYVYSKFVRQEAVEIYYIPWPAKKNCCPKFVHKFVCQKQPKTVQPAQPTSQSCQKTNFKRTYCRYQSNKAKNQQHF